MSLFQKAKEKAPAKSAKKDDKLLIKIEGKEFDEALKTLAETSAELKIIEAENEMAKGIVKEQAQSEFAKIYNKEKINVGSFNIYSESGASVMYLPTKKYITIDEARAQELKKKYGEEMVNEETTYAFNSALIGKYADILSELIENCDAINKDDKELLIEAKVKYGIASDSLDKCAFYSEKAKVSTEEVLQDLNYVGQLKGAKLAK